MSTNGTAPLKHTTKCRHCQSQFTASPLGIPIIGEDAPARVVKFVSILADHLYTHHKTEMDKLGGTIQDFSGLLIVNQFETDDPGLEARADAIRADIHKRTGKHFITDEALDQLVNRLQLGEGSGTESGDEQTRAVREVLRGIRDAYEELGNWSPEALQKRLVVV